MSMKKSTDPKQVHDPELIYKKRAAMPIRFFASFEEENEFVAKERCEMSYDERMLYFEQLRKQVFYTHVLPPEGRWEPLEKVFTVMSPYTNDIS